MVALFLFSACSTASLSVDTGRHHGRDTDTADSADTGDTADSGDTGDTGPIIDTGPVEYDCAALPEPTIREMEGPRGYHDVAFDDLGNLLGTDGRSLLASTYDGKTSAFVPGLIPEGIDRLPSGDFVATNLGQGTLELISPDGSHSTLATGLTSGYQITVGPDGDVYVGNVYRSRRPEITKVNAATGELTTWLQLPRGSTPRMVQFNLDSTVAYIATIGSGTVYKVAVGPDLMPTGEPEVFATGIGSWHDGLAMDACGNLYVAEYSTAGLYKVTPDGTVSTVYSGRTTKYGHGLEWGSGIGGWRKDAVYLPQPYDNSTVREVVLGVAAASTVRTWTPAP